MDDTAIIPFDPQPNDVVGLQSKWARQHPGNVVYRNLLVKYCAQLEVKKAQPTAQDFRPMVDDMFDELIHKREGRFLKVKGVTEGFCLIMSENECKNKINTALRNWFYYEKKRHVKAAPPSSESEDNSDDELSENAHHSKRITGNSCEKQLPSIVTKRIHAKAKAKIVDDDDASHGTNDYDNPTRCVVNKPVILTPSPLSEVWNYEELYKNTSQSYGVVKLYGSQEDEIRMRRWLNDHDLPQSVGDTLVRLGARNVEDALLLVTDHSNLLNKLAFLDLYKLERAVQSNGGSHCRH